LKFVKVRGYKRFGTEQCLDTRAPVVAVVGPNEAGKTSLLQAIQFLSRDNALDRSEFTDRRDNNGDWVVSAEYALDADDLSALGDLVPPRITFTYQVSKYANGDIDRELDPRLPRDLTARQQAVKELNQFAGQAWLDEIDEDDQATMQGQCQDLASRLDSTQEYLSSKILDLITGLTGRLQGVEARRSRQAAVNRLARVLARTHEVEDAPTPEHRIIEVLEQREPSFLLCGGTDLNLKAEYVWADKATAPPALEHLFALTDVTYQELRDVSRNDDRTEQERLRELADGQLKAVFARWRQSKLHVALAPDQQSLQLQIRDHTTGARTDLNARSAGLRRFVGLVAFTARHSRGAMVPPVLLVDEAETHLHYSAQADLVRVFERQRAAATVIYTTHSIGCLPTDLGASIRVVSPEPENGWSSIRNTIWASAGRRVGITPLMLAMGATALAFTPARRAVIAEGATEAILLPTLLREALPLRKREEGIKYQIVPGISEVNPQAAHELEMEAGAVAYLVDDDEGGCLHRRKLSRRAKRDGRVVVLGKDGPVLDLGDEEGAVSDKKQLGDDGLCLEDFVDAHVLAAAVNTVVSGLSALSGPTLTTDHLPDVGRGAYIKRWAKQEHGIDGISKVWVAQAVLDIGRETGDSLLERSRKEYVRKLHTVLDKATRPPERPQDD
jgi:hypothetical protein